MSSQNQTKIDRNSGSVRILFVGLFSATIYFNEKAQDPFNTPKLIILMVVAGWLIMSIKPQSSYYLMSFLF